MGAFFTNFQVYRKDGTQAADLILHVLAAIKEEAASSGFVETKGSAACERSVLVASSKGSRWITVYDQATEDQDEKKFSALGQTLSKKLSEFVASVLVHDSDILHVDLFNDGQCVNVFRSLPKGYPGETVATTFDGWAELLPNTDSLKAAFNHRTMFAEATLERIAQVVGFDQRCVSQGFNYATAEGDRLDGLQIKKLQFRNAGPAKPMFRGEIVSFRNDSEPDALVQLTAIIKNDGGPCTGLQIEISNIAISSGQLKHVAAKITDANDTTPLIFSEMVTQGGGVVRLLRAKLPDYKFETELRLRVSATVAKVGGGPLHITVFAQPFPAKSMCTIHMPLKERDKPEPHPPQISQVHF
jgi:hypothetical protein